MAHLGIGQGRLLAATLAAAVAMGVSARSITTATSCAADAGIPDPAAPVRDVRADNIAISPEAASNATTDAFDDPDDTALTQLQSKFEQVANRVAPAVVSISAAQTASDIDATVRSDEMSTQRLQSVLDKTTRTIGTGFIVDSDGFIVTNEHVIEDSEQFWVTMDDHKVYPAIVVGADPRQDLAVLKIPASKLPTVRFAEHPSTRGEWAITLGNPYGLATEGQMAVSVGVVSATDRSLPRLATTEDRLYSNMIQTTAQINPGNSGGPLLDIEGRVIGIDTAVIMPQKQTNGIGFALTITPELQSEVAQLEQGREMVYGYMGVTVATPTVQQRRDAKLGTAIGVSVESVEQGSPADAPGEVQPGDIIVALNSQTVSDTAMFVRMVGKAPVGRMTFVTVVRGGEKLTLPIKLVKRPVQYAITNENQRMYWRGMELGPVPTNWPNAAADDKHRAGILVVGIEDDSPMKKQGVCAGMVITAIAGRPVATMIEMQRILNDVPPEQCTVQTAADTTEVVAEGK